MYAKEVGTTDQKRILSIPERHKKSNTQTASDFCENFQESCDANNGEING